MSERKILTELLYMPQWIYNWEKEYEKGSMILFQQYKITVLQQSLQVANYSFYWISYKVQAFILMLKNFHILKTLTLKE